MPDEPIGEIPIEITGDFSQFEEALVQAVANATAAAQILAGAFDIPNAGEKLIDVFDQTGNAAVNAGQQFSLFGGQVQDTTGQLDLFDTNSIEAADSMSQIGDAATGATQPVTTLGNETENAGDKAKQGGTDWSELLTTLGQFAAIEITAGALKDLAEDAIAAFSQVQTATIALGAMSGSAANATAQVAALRDQANNDALAFPSLLSAAQRMTAFGLSSSETTQILQLSADAAAATGNGFDQVSQSLGRLVENGTAGARQLTQLGITQQQLAAVMGVSTAEVAADFKALDPSERLAIAGQALQKFAGDAQLMAQTVTGEFNKLENASNQTFTQIGASIAPAVAGLTEVATVAVAGFGNLWTDTLGKVEIQFQDFFTFLASGSTVGYTAFMAGAQQIKEGVNVITAAFAGGKTANEIFNTSMAATFKTLSDNQGSLTTLSIDLDTAKDKLASGQITADQYRATVVAYGAALDKASTSGVTFADSVDGVQLAQSKANTLLVEATSTLAQVSPGTADYARAVQNVSAAWDAANPGGVKFADTMMGIGQTVSQQVATYASLSSTFNQLSQGFQNGTVSANLFLDVAAKLSSAATATHQPFASMAVDIANIQLATDQEAQSNDAAVGAFDAILKKFNDGTVGLQALQKAYKDAQTAAENAGTSFSNAAAAALLMTNTATNQIQAFRDNVAILAQFKDTLTLTDSQSIAAATALKNLQTAGAALGITVTQVAGSQTAFTLSTTNATPAVQKLVDQFAAQFSQLGLTVTAIDNVSKANTGFVNSANPFGVILQSIGVAAGQASLQLNTVANSTIQLAQASLNIHDPLQGTANALQSITQAANTQVNSAEGLFNAWVSLNETAQTSISGQLALQDAFSKTQSALAALGIRLTANGATTTSSSTAVQGLVKQLNDAIAVMNGTGGPAANAASGIAAIGAAAKQTTDALAEMDAQNAEDDKGLLGMDSSATTIAAMGLVWLKNGELNKATNTPGTDTIGMGGDPFATVDKTNQELENLQEGLNADGTAITGSTIATEQATLAAQKAAAATADNTTATAANTTATVASTTATTTATVAFGNLVNGIQGATDTTTALKDVNNDLGTSFTDVGSSLQAVETMIGETSGSLKQQFENLASELNSTNESLSPYPDTLYSATTATGTATTALQNLTASTTGVASSLTGLVESTNTTTITQAQYQSDLQSYTDQVNAGTMSAQDASKALSTLAQEAMNAGQAVTQATGGIAAIAASVSVIDPNVLKKALDTYSAGTAGYDSAFSDAGRGAANVDQANQQNAFNTYSQLGAAFTSATGLTIPNQGVAEAQVNPNLTYDPQTGLYTVALTLNAGLSTDQTTGVTTQQFTPGAPSAGPGETLTASGTTLQGAEQALAALVQNGGVFSTGATGAEGMVTQATQGTQGTNFAALGQLALGDYSKTNYTVGNPLPVTLANPPVAINITVNGANQTNNQLAEMIRQTLVASFRQAGLKI